MTRPTDTIEVDYPETDRLPMGESELPRYWMIRLVDLLQHRYRDQRVWVGGNLMFYYRQGRRDSVCPDAFVVRDCDPEPPRDVFKTWEEPHAPHAVFEVTSKSTRKEDELVKPAVYAEIGVGEYFLYDPRAEYLDPPLQGFRLAEGGYQPIEADAQGRLASEELDLWLAREGRDLVLFDRTTGGRLLTAQEAAESAREATEARWLAEKAAREAAETARQAEKTAREAAEAEVERLRKLLESGSDESE